MLLWILCYRITASKERWDKNEQCHSNNKVTKLRNEKVTLDVERQRDHVTHQIGRGETIKEVEVEAPGDIDIQVSYMAMDHTHIHIRPHKLNILFLVYRIHQST